ncbi:unnamed protein product [Schistocephalus solidus]|uniref:Uncharacterized protein n=1 Tax=Schistocephalus solidus TaxID=70667 RepID=A0A183SSC4_SCHSO|nr:unnamed protein product [Schistocephalus solidus]
MFECNSQLATFLSIVLIVTDLSPPPTDPGGITEPRRPEAGDGTGGWRGRNRPWAQPSKPARALIWEWAHWLTGRRTRFLSPQHDLAPITHTPEFIKYGGMEEPFPSDSQSTRQSFDTQNIQWTNGVNCCKRQIGSLPSNGFLETVLFSGWEIKVGVEFHIRQAIDGGVGDGGGLVENALEMFCSSREDWCHLSEQCPAVGTENGGSAFDWRSVDSLGGDEEVLPFVSVRMDLDRLGFA